jgi:hypothetical protein
MNSLSGIRSWCVVLIGGLCLLHFGSVVRSADAQGGPAGAGQGQFFTPSWDNNLPINLRFTVLTAFNNEAVRDNNTGLVWEKVADTTSRAWSQARGFCLSKNIGGATGWRLPSIVELRSVSPAPSSVFSRPGADYWSSSTVADLPTHAWAMDIDLGSTGISPKTSENFVWCVRGPMQESVY